MLPWPRFYEVEHAAAHDMMAFFSHMIARHGSRAGGF